MILAGDVGGTKTRLALYEPGTAPRRPAREGKFPSGDHASLEELVRAFLDETGARPERAVLGIAGPVVDNRTEATNLPWTIDGDAMGGSFDCRVTLMNDLEVTAWGIPELGDAELEVLQPGRPAPGNRALIAAGTGLGEAIMSWDGTTWRPSASEGGHADFASRDPLEDELLVWMRAKYGRVSYERVLSGPGLADLYRFLSATGRGSEPPGFAERFENAEDPAAEVTAAGLDGSSSRARLALEHFVSVYGAEAGNLALKAFAVGGMYVGGGIAPRMMGVIRDGGLLSAFRAKGRLSPVLERIPISVILDDRAALWGAAAVALG